MASLFYNTRLATGINITVGNDSVSIDACSIIIKNKQLDFEKKLTGIMSIAELTKHFEFKPAIALNIIGKGVLIKQVERLEEVTNLTLQQVLPNANFNDFYIQNFVSGDKSFIALIRKTEADSLVVKLKNAGFTPIILSLGPFVANPVLGQLNIYDTDAVFDGHHIKLNNDRAWETYQYKSGERSNFVLKIENEIISEQLVLPYGAAFQLAMGSRLNPVKANVGDVEDARQKADSSKKIRSSFLVITVVFFCVLLINFLVLSWYDDANKQLLTRVNSYQTNNNDLNHIATAIAKKEDTMNELGWDGGINKALLIDQLAASLPAEITWSYLSVNPLQKTGNFADRRIEVVGYSQRLLNVNEWMARAKLIHWVKSIQLENYSFNAELKTGQFIVNVNY